MAKKNKPARKRGRPQKTNTGTSTGAPLSERFMIRCTKEQLSRWKAEAERRGLARGNDSGVGRLVGIVLDRVCAGETMSIRAGEHTLTYTGVKIGDRERDLAVGEVVANLLNEVKS